MTKCDEKPPTALQSATYGVGPPRLHAVDFRGGRLMPCLSRERAVPSVRRASVAAFPSGGQTVHGDSAGRRGPFDDLRTNLNQLDRWHD